MFSDLVFISLMTIVGGMIVLAAYLVRTFGVRTSRTLARRIARAGNLRGGGGHARARPCRNRCCDSRKGRQGWCPTHLPG